MDEGAVGLGHAVGVVATFDGGSGAVGGVEEFGGEFFAHGAAVAIACCVEDPAHGEGDAPVGADFDGYLVGGAADAAWFDFEDGCGGADGLLEDVEGVATGLGLDAVEGAVDDFFGDALFAPSHEFVDEDLDVDVAVAWVRWDGAFFGLGASGHVWTPGFFCLGWLAFAAGGGLGVFAGAVFGAALFAVVDAGGIEGAADDVVADAGEVFDAAAADEDDGVFLEVVAFAWDVGGDFDAVDEAHAGDFAEGGVGFFGGLGADLGADAAFLGVAAADGFGELAGVGVEAEEEGRRARLLRLFGSPSANELVDGRHSCFPCDSAFGGHLVGRLGGCRGAGWRFGHENRPKSLFVNSAPRWFPERRAVFKHAALRPVQTQKVRQSRSAKGEG